MRGVFEQGGGRTHLADLYERGALRLRFPRTRGCCEAVLVNTGGGITGGDRLRINLTVGARAALTVTSQAAEKIYATDGPPAVIAVEAAIDEDATLEWLPQETIVFDRARAERSLDINMRASGRLTVLECLVLGRMAHGERLRAGTWRDHWRIRRDGKLLLAENVRLEGDIANLLERPAVGAGACAVATFVHIAGNAEARLGAVREAIAGAGVVAGASAWNGMLVARMASDDPRALRDTAMRTAAAVINRALPRAFMC